MILYTEDGNYGNMHKYGQIKMDKTWLLLAVDNVSMAGWLPMAGVCLLLIVVLEHPRQSRPLPLLPLHLHAELVVQVDVDPPVDHVLADGDEAAHCH